MKFGKITSANVSRNALSLGGAVAGGALSGGILTLVPQEQKVMARGGMAALGLIGSASVKAKSSTENLVKFALLGIGIAQSAKLIEHFAAQQITITDTSTASQKFVAGMVGLACPCDEQPALASPVINFGALKGGAEIPQNREVPQITAVYREQEAEKEFEVPVGAFI